MIVLLTERLILRWFRPDDAAVAFELVNDPDWIRNIGDRGVRSIDDARAWIENRVSASYFEHGFGSWAMQRREDGALLGTCGLVRRASLPTLDLGYALLPRARGQGYVREAATACLAYARDVLEEPRVFAITYPSNVASVRALESIGMQHEQTTMLPGEARESAVFSWTGATPTTGDRQAIDAVARRLFAAFDNRGGKVPTVAALPALFAPDARVTVADARGATTTNVRDFLLPRAALLESRLREFSEDEIEARTEITGAIAQRWCVYEKAGILDGEPFRARGTKAMQLVKIAGRWKLVALAWQDYPATVD